MMTASEARTAFYIAEGIVYEVERLMKYMKDRNEDYDNTRLVGMHSNAYLFMYELSSAVRDANKREGV
jgi:hypothetical protein